MQLRKLVSSEPSGKIDSSGCVQLTSTKQVDENDDDQEYGNPNSIIRSLVPESPYQRGEGSVQGVFSYQNPISTAPALSSAGRMMVQLYPTDGQI